MKLNSVHNDIVKHRFQFSLVPCISPESHVRDIKFGDGKCTRYRM